MPTGWCSACNTTSGDGNPGAEPLSGLAWAFFYAGARSLLVSHREVPSLSAVPLLIGVFEAKSKDPQLSNAVRCTNRCWRSLTMRKIPDGIIRHTGRRSSWSATRNSAGRFIRSPQSQPNGREAGRQAPRLAKRATGPVAFVDPGQRGTDRDIFE